MQTLRSRTLDTAIAAGLIFAFAAGAWPIDRPPVHSGAATSPVLAMGTPVHAFDGTPVGSVTGISRDEEGNVERIRVTTQAWLGPRRVLIVRPADFAIQARRVQLTLSVGQLRGLPSAMLDDAG